MKWMIIACICFFIGGFGFGQFYAPETKAPKYGLTEHTQDVKAAKHLYDSARFYKADRDEAIERRVLLQQENAQLKQQLQQYQAAVEKINDRLKKAKDTPSATNSPTVSTNQAAKEGK